MTCDAIRALLELEDIDARVDRAALRTHLETCAPCRARYPEVTTFVGLRASAGKRPSLVPSFAAAAALLLVTLGLTRIEPAPTPEDEGHVRWLPASASRVERSIVRLDRGRERRSTVRWETRGREDWKDWKDWKD